MRDSDPELEERPLEEIYDDPLRAALLRNHMVRMFSLDARRDDRGRAHPRRADRDHLERAQDRLRPSTWSGSRSSFEEFCAELTRRFGWDLGPPIFMNRTEPGPDLRLPARVASPNDNALDVELYEFARAAEGLR